MKPKQSKHWVFEPCPQPDRAALEAALARQATLTKPAGSLGRLEDIAVKFASWQSNETPVIDKILIRVFAADHGVCAQNVSAFGQEVTGQMIQNFLNGGAAISVLANSLGADFRVVNLGTIGSINDHSKLTNAQIAPSTQDLSLAPAMTSDQLERALNVGRSEVLDFTLQSTTSNSGCLFIGGEMGIGNTTAASAIYASRLGLTAKHTVGPGTGLTPSEQTHKSNVVDAALKCHQSKLNDPLSVLQHVGGFEIAALTGAYITAAQCKIPSLIDGFICTAAALLACEINPNCRDWMLFSHTSAEPAHGHALEKLRASPLLDLGLRLGEGSGAAVAVPILLNALNLHANMATFDAAGVSDKHA
ncbi:nicotinate-nucleotide--dimethylbenzimidazole phosphoribosyltransferase [Arenicella sp. 4NH20-0111]|uniref:nicotinate-nucleotide--dimethylbenzimidazole phosphoribosyltransferase n=1 Tax=Arenicella sp. 4NH20-0111 TaxID=3127648 RepID=UPI00310366AA